MDRSKMMNLIGTGLVIGAFIFGALLLSNGSFTNGFADGEASSMFASFGESDDDESGLFGFGEGEEEKEEEDEDESGLFGFGESEEEDDDEDV